MNQLCLGQRLRKARSDSATQHQMLEHKTARKCTCNTSRATSADSLHDQCGTEICGSVCSDSISPDNLLFSSATDIEIPSDLEFNSFIANTTSLSDLSLLTCTSVGMQGSCP